MNMNVLFLAFLFIMIVNTSIGMITLLVQLDKRKGKKIEDLKTTESEIIRCKTAAMQLFAGLGKLMELLEGLKSRGSWNKSMSQLVIKEMEKEKRRIEDGKTIVQKREN